MEVDGPSTHVPVPSSKSGETSTDGDSVLTPETNGVSPRSRSVPLPDMVEPTSGLEAVVDRPTLGATTAKSRNLARTPRNSSFSGSSSFHEDWDLTPLDRLTVLDLLDNFALPQQIEKIQKGIHAQTEKVRKQRDALKNKSHLARERMVEEWRRRVPSAEEQLERYRKRMRASVEKLGRQWNNTKIITAREKVSFICGVMNIFISAYLLGGYPDFMPLWYTVQVLYFMPIRFYTYHSRGYHYFLADLCYFVNFLLLISLWLCPGSKRLFTAVFCLAFGNNAVAIVMWRNSLVFHSFDKVTSLFIHIMPCATLHSIVHLLDEETLKRKYPSVWTIKASPPGSPTAYANILSMLAWSTIPYAIWQLAYYFFITVRRRDKIAAGRPTSFTWLRRSYSKVWIGKVVLALPDALQEPAFMLIQYLYAVLTMLPCPLWFYSRWASSAFLMIVFTWSIYNGSTFYIDVFGKRFQKELEAMRAEVAKWQASPDGSTSPPMTPHPVTSAENDGEVRKLGLEALHESSDSLDNIPLLHEEKPATVIAGGTAVETDGGIKDVARERRVSER